MRDLYFLIVPTCIAWGTLRAIYHSYFISLLFALPFHMMWCDMICVCLSVCHTVYHPVCVSSHLDLGQQYLYTGAVCLIPCWVVCITKQSPYLLLSYPCNISSIAYKHFSLRLSLFTFHLHLNVLTTDNPNHHTTITAYHYYHYHPPHIHTYTLKATVPTQASASLYRC